MFEWLKIFKKHKWTLKYTVSGTFEWTDKGRTLDIEKMTYFLEENENGERRFYHHTYGLCKKYNKHELFKDEIILWQKTGIVPRDAVNVLVEKLKGTV
jgi:hypothetical protein